MAVDYHLNWNGTLAALLPLAAVWTGYIGLKLRQLATIKFWEIVILLPVCCAPVFGTFYVAGLSEIWVWIIVCFGWIGLLTIDERNKRVGTFTHEGHFRILAIGRKKGLLIKSEEDLHKIDVLVLSETDYDRLGRGSDAKLQHLIVRAVSLDIEVLPISTFIEDVYGYVDLVRRNDTEQIGLKRRRILKETKRQFDLLLSLLLMPIAIPIMATIVLMSFIFQGFPIFFKQLRLGKGGRSFSIIKFRTMADASIDDGDVTKFGAVLRQTHLDELPQLINVLRGEMSFVGPRPEWVILSTPKTAPSDYWLRQAIRPGLTGWAQVIYKPSRTKTMRQRKLGYDLYYVNKRSILLDILIWFRTFLKLPMFFVSIFVKRLRRGAA